MTLVVEDAGLCSLLVDGGRPHLRHRGVPLGGAADRWSWQLGNALVGNPPDATALEVTLVGPALRAEQPVAVAVCGAEFVMSVDGEPRPAGAAFPLLPGEVLRIGPALRGARAYVCVAGGFLVPPLLGSRSSFEPLAASTHLPCPAARIGRRCLPLQACPLPDAAAAIVLRVVDGPQRAWFPDESFFQQEYEVLPASNRMGVRLRGQPLARRPGEMLSEPVAPGAVQVTHDGQPIVLGVDGQTIGGYPKIAHVIQADLDRLAQLRPGQRVRFQRVDHATAAAAWTCRQQELRQWLRRIRHAEGGPQFLDLPSG